MDRDTVYHKCGISSLEATTHHDENGKVDRAEFDHYFWINAGDAEHVIRGFYKSPTESKLFVFEEPTRKRGRERDEGDDVEAMEVLHSTGVIRISFARVERFDTRQTGLKCSPQQATIDGRINQKSSSLPSLARLSRTVSTRPNALSCPKKLFSNVELFTIRSEDSVAAIPSASTSTRLISTKACPSRRFYKSLFGCKPFSPSFDG